MFANLFKPKWRHSDPEVRACAIGKLHPDHPEQAVILCQLALNDSNQNVRLRAVRRLSDTESLLTVLQQSRDPEIREQAGVRVSECFDDNQSQGSLHQLLERIDDDATRTRIIIHTSCTHLETDTLNSIRDEAVLMQIALNAKLANIRKEAAQRIDSTELLEQIQRASRGRDKTVHRISRDKLNSLREQARQATETDQRRQQLLAQLQQLAVTHDTQYLQARAQALYQEWQQLGSAGAEQQQFADLQQTIEQRLQQQADAEAAVVREREAQQAREQQAQALLEQLAALTPTHGAATTAAEQLASLQQQWQTLSGTLSARQQSQWQKGTQAVEQTVAALTALDQHDEQLERLLTDDQQPLPQRLRKVQQLIGKIDWPAQTPAPERLQQLTALADTLKQQQADLSAEARQQTAEISHQVDQLEQAIESGNVIDADRLQQALSKRMEQLGTLLPDALEARFRQLHARLAELQDWQGFAVSGKKESLCAQMEALIGVELAPQALADQIRNLQQEWKQVDANDPLHSQKLWKRFHEAGEKAYAPCQQWFGSQRKQREFNLTQRQQICDQLELYLKQMDWNQADWTAVEAISRTAREEWRTYTPVDRAPGKPLQQQFNALLRELDQQVKQHRQHCGEIKEQLIAQASELATADDVSAAADAAKQLQQQWKNAGPTFRSRERALWQAFREQCDLIFARLKEQRKAQASQERQQAQTQKAMLPDMAIEALQRLALLAEQSEEELVTQGSSETLSTLLTEAITGPSPGEHWRERIGVRLEAIRLISAGTRSIEQQLAISERQARELCIRLEILLSLASPEEDEALRMEYQMERLSQALAQQDDEPTPAALQALELEWLTLPFAWQFGELHDRFVQQLQSA
ncbi:MAG: DUF349 domain-containing protein [Oceanospirillales bacterium]|nr:DUF349 domain-containing protein [Oceanospirillales bacterium]